MVAAMSFYPANPPDKFVPYSTELDCYYDERAAVWHYIVLGSWSGVTSTFRIYGFTLAAPYTRAVEFSIAIPIVHGVLRYAAGRLYIFGESERALFWQDGPALTQSTVQKAVATVYTRRPPFKVLTKEQHDQLPICSPGLFEKEFKRLAA